MMGSYLKTTVIVDDSAHAVEFDGFSISETGASASVTVTFRDTTVGGALLHAPVIVPAGGLVTAVFPLSVALTGGSVYVDVSGTGTLSGVLYTRV